MTPDDQWFSPSHVQRIAPVEKKREPVWTVQKEAHVYAGSLLYHGEHGVEMQVFKDGEMLWGYRFNTRAEALAMAESERVRLEAYKRVRSGTVSDMDDRVGALEKRLIRVERHVERLMRVRGIVYPLINNDATDEQIDAVLAFLSAATKDVQAGHGPSPGAFAARIFELLPHRVDHKKLPGVLATWCFDGDLRPLYYHLRDAGLADLDRSIETNTLGEPRI